MSSTHLFSLVPPIRDERQLSFKIQKVISYIHENYFRAIKLDQISMSVGLHPQYLSRRFKKELGITVHQYLLVIRIKKAIELLSRLKGDIKKVAYEVGFSRPEVFSKVFKKITGCSPTEYVSRNFPLSVPLSA